VELDRREQSEMYFDNMVPRPDAGIACLSFRYKKYLKDGSALSRFSKNKTPLEVLAWPFRGRPGKVNIQRDSPNENSWIRAEVTFRRVENFFVILFRATSPSARKLFVALDDVSVKDGACPLK